MHTISPKRLITKERHDGNGALDNANDRHNQVIGDFCFSNKNKTLNINVSVSTATLRPAAVVPAPP